MRVLNMSVRCSVSMSRSTFFLIWQLILRSESRYFCKGSIIADSREEATGLMVITSGQVDFSSSRKKWDSCRS